jgi:hypothetical protein
MKIRKRITKVRKPVRNTLAVVKAKANRGIRRLKHMRF